MDLLETILKGRIMMIPLMACSVMALAVFLDRLMAFYANSKIDVPALRSNLMRLLREHKVKVKVVMEFDNVEMIKRAVEIDAGIAVLPKMTVDREVSLRTLTVVPFAKQTYTRPLGILVKRGRQIPTVMQRFLEVLLGEA